MRVERWMLLFFFVLRIKSLKQNSNLIETLSMYSSRLHSSRTPQRQKYLFKHSPYLVDFDAPKNETHKDKCGNESNCTSKDCEESGKDQGPSEEEDRGGHIDEVCCLVS